MANWDGYRAALAEDPAGVLAVRHVAHDLGLDWAELAWVIEIESRWRPWAWNTPKSKNLEYGASGLIQWLPKTLQGLGYTGTMADFRRLSRSEQAPWIAAYFRNVGVPPRGDVYVAVAGSGGIGRPDDAVLYPVGSDGWVANRSWRTANDGPVLVGTVRAIGRPPSLPPESPIIEIVAPPTEPRGVWAAVAGALAIATAVGVYVALRKPKPELEPGPTPPPWRPPLRPPPRPFRYSL
jgi:hypothetical protein